MHSRHLLEPRRRETDVGRRDPGMRERRPPDLADQPLEARGRALAECRMGPADHLRAPVTITF